MCRVLDHLYVVHVTHSTPAPLPRQLPWGAAGAARRIGAQNARVAMLQKRCQRGHTARTSTRACAAGSRLAQCRRRRCGQHAVDRELSRRLSRSAAHADGAVRNGSTNVCLAPRDTRGGPRACCSRATTRRRACAVESAGTARVVELVTIWSDCASRGGCELRRPGGRRSLVRLSARAPRPFIRSRESPPVPLFTDCILKQNNTSTFTLLNSTI